MATILPARPIEKSNLGQAMFQSIEAAQADQRQKALALLLQQRREDMAIDERQSRMDLATFQANATADLAKANYSYQSNLIDKRSAADIRSEVAAMKFKEVFEAKRAANMILAVQNKDVDVPEITNEDKEATAIYPYEGMTKEQYSSFLKLGAADIGLEVTNGVPSTTQSRLGKAEETKAATGLELVNLQKLQVKAATEAQKEAWEVAKLQRSQEELKLNQVRRTNKIAEQQYNDNETASKAAFADIFFPDKIYSELSREEVKAIDDKWTAKDGLGGIYRSMYGMTLDRNTGRLVPAESVSRSFFYNALGVKKVIKSQGFDEDMQVTEVTEPDPVIDTAMWLRKELTKQAVLEGDWAMVKNIDSAVVSAIQLQQAGLQNSGEAGLVAFAPGIKGYELTDTGAYLMKYGIAAAKGNIYTKLPDYTKDALHEAMNDPSNNSLPSADGLGVEGRAALKAAVSMELGKRIADPPLFPHIDLIDKLATKITGIKEKVNPGTVLPNTIAQSMAASGRWFSFFDNKHEAAKEKMEEKEFNLPPGNTFQGQLASAATDTNEFSKPEYGSFYFGSQPMEGVPYATEKRYRAIITDLMQAYADDPSTEGKLMPPDTLENALLSATSMNEEVLTHFTSRYHSYYNQLINQQGKDTVTTP